MTCELNQRDDLIIGYVEGVLKPQLRKEFEAHYFLCSECFTQLQRMEQIISLMRREARSIFPNDRGSDGR